MGPNFLECDRDQVLLLPPSLREWLPDNHLAWFVIEAVDRLDLSAFYGVYRLDGQGRAAHEPSMMVALLLYSYALGERSSRRIERRCVEDVATRVICANRAPDHTTIARFRQRHEGALAELFGEVLWLCADAGLVRVGVVAVDGTKVHANASHHASRDYEQIAREILEHADAVDAEEDYRRNGRMRNGRRLGAHSPPKPYQPPEAPEGKINLSDLDSRNVKTPRGWVQGYNAQAVTTADQIVIAAEVTVDSPDFGHLEPMVRAACGELERAGVEASPEVVLGDAGYWHQVQMQRLVAAGMTVLVPPDAKKRAGARPGWDGGLYAFMRRVLASDPGGALYAKRQTMVEPVFADTKFNRRIDRFLRRGRAAARSEWRIASAAHNLLKLWRHTTAPATA